MQLVFDVFTFFFLFFNVSPEESNNNSPPIENFHLDGVLAAFPELLHRADLNGAELPVSINRHRQNRGVKPAQVRRLAQVRQFRDDGYFLTSRHLAVYVRNVTAFMDFRRDYARQGFPNRMVRTIFFEELTIDFPMLRRALDGLQHVQMITFRNVRLEMSSWRNLRDQVFLFRSRRQRIVNFENCEFLEDVCIVMFEKDAESKLKDPKAEETHFRRIMANRIPVFFYLQLVKEGLLVGLNRSSAGT